MNFLLQKIDLINNFGIDCRDQSVRQLVHVKL